MRAIIKIIDGHSRSLHVGSERYRLLLELHLKLCEVTLAVTSERELLWVAERRGRTERKVGAGRRSRRTARWDSPQLAKTPRAGRLISNRQFPKPRDAAMAVTFGPRPPG